MDNLNLEIGDNIYLKKSNKPYEISHINMSAKECYNIYFLVGEKMGVFTEDIIIYSKKMQIIRNKKIKKLLKNA